MAIAFDAKSDNNFSAATSATLAHTATGSNGLVFVGVSNALGVTCTGVTWDGNAMTQVGSSQTLTGTSEVSVWYYFAGSFAGTSKNVIASFGSSATSRIRVTTYTGVKQSGIDSSAQTAVGGGDPYTLTTTVVQSDCWVAAFVKNNTDNMTAGSGTTIRTSSTTSDDSALIADSNGTVATGSISLNYDVPAASTSVGSIISFATATASTANSNFFLLL